MLLLVRKANVGNAIGEINPNIPIRNKAAPVPNNSLL